ncbi:hypothetical protein V5799_028747 [Amblyomma americanum]|uniref:Uncharacterized protein n=1 Tax=Amblyomma americanum TaxID=6943 RepID=A0AAQ4DBZ9_AMBAM
MDGCIYTLRDHWQIPHDLEIKFLRKLRPELICSTCDAVTPRGFKDERNHVYCQKCVQVFTDDKNEFTCQVCDWHGSRKYMESTQNEWKNLEKMESVCPNEKSACYFSGPLKAVLEHYLSCKVKGKAPCSLCGLLLEIKLLAKHINDECPKRILECTFCNSDVTACDKRAHETNCGERPAVCPHCKQPIKTYNQLEQEHYPICPRMPLSCEFEALGCLYKAARCDMVRHISQSRHDTLFVQAICDLRRENEGLNMFIRQKLATLERCYEEKVKHLSATVAQLQDKTDKESNLLGTLTNSLGEMQHELQALKTAQQTGGDLFEERITETQLAIERLDRELHLNPMMPGFEYVWKIQPYFALKNAAMASTREISSGVVYIKKPGYALEFIVGFPHPSGMFSAPQLSFKCRIHAGDFDDMLPWPLKNKLILILFNQQDERGSKSFELDTETVDPTAVCFNKPASGEANAKFGFTEVISIPLLENANKGFLLRDCVVLKIAVP